MKPQDQYFRKQYLMISFEMTKSVVLKFELLSTEPK